MPTCDCDMFPDRHEAGFIDASGTKCETLLVGPMISPHMFPGQTLTHRDNPA